MKLPAKSVIALLPFLLMAAALPAVAAPSEEMVLRKLEHTWMNAARHRDVATLKQILSDDYVDISWQGKVRDKSDALRAPALSSALSQKIDGFSIRVWGDAAVITGRGRLLDASGNQRVVWRFTDVFIRNRQHWRAVSSEETPVSG